MYYSKTGQRGLEPANHVLEQQSQQGAQPSPWQQEVDPRHSKLQAIGIRDAKAALYSFSQDEAAATGEGRDELSAGLLKATAPQVSNRPRTLQRPGVDGTFTASRRSHSAGSSRATDLPVQHNRSSEIEHRHGQNCARPTSVATQSTVSPQRTPGYLASDSRPSPSATRPIELARRPIVSEQATFRSNQSNGGPHTVPEIPSRYTAWLQNESRKSSQELSQATLVVASSTKGHSQQAQGSKGAQELGRGRASRRMPGSSPGFALANRSQQQPLAPSINATVNQRPTAVAAWPLLEEADTESQLRSDLESQQAANNLSPEESLRSQNWGEMELAHEEELSDDAQQLAELKASLRAAVMPDVHVVDTREEAERIVHLLTHDYKDLTFACDTEVGPTWRPHFLHRAPGNDIGLK